MCMFLVPCFINLTSIRAAGFSLRGRPFRLKPAARLVVRRGSICETLC